MRQRVVGVVVLVVLAAVLTPLLLNLDGEYIVDQRSQIPPRPNIVPVEIPPPEAVAGLEQADNPEQLFDLDESRGEATSQQTEDDTDAVVTQPGLTAEGIPESWVLQVASFTDQGKAKALTDRLLADKYHAYSKHFAADGKTNYRVFVGPKILKQDLVDEQVVIEKKYRVKALVMRFEP